MFEVVSGRGIFISSAAIAFLVSGLLLHGASESNLITSLVRTGRMRLSETIVAGRSPLTSQSTPWEG